MLSTALKKVFYAIRRSLLRRMVPERIWPSSVHLDGVEIQIRHTPYSFGTKWTLAKGEYETPERKLLVGAVTEGSQVLEFGGSIGVLSAIISKRIGSRGRLVSVEASADLVAFSRRWLEQLGNVTVLCGIAFPVDEVPQHLCIESFDESLGAIAGRVGFSLLRSGTTGTWPTYGINRIIREYGIYPEVLVVDIEGSEAILQSVEANIPQCVRRIIIELHPFIYPNGAADEARIIDAIQREGFRLLKRISSSYLFSRAGVHEHG